MRSGGRWRWRAAWLAALLLAWVGTALARLEAAPALRVGYPVADAPYSQRNAVGQAEGASLGLVSAWLRRAGLPPAEWVPLAPGEGPGALQAGRIDLLLGVRGEAPPGLRLIGPYQRAPVVIVSAGRYSLTGAPALAGHRVAVAAALQPQLAALAVSPAPQWRVTQNSAEALGLVARGEADAALSGLHAAAERLRTPALAELRITGVASELSDARWIALRADRPALAEPLLATLGPVLAEVLPGLEAEWAARAGAGAIDWVQVREVVLVASLVIGALLASALWHGRLLRREEAATQAARAQVAQLFGFLAHDVRNALQSVTGAVTLWQRRGAAGAAWPAGELSALTAAVAASAAAAVGRLDGLLDRHRLQSGTLGLQRRPEPLDELLCEVVGEAQAAARAAGVVLQLAPRTAEPGWWLVDAFRLQQVLRNLLAHALAARPPGGVSVALALHPSPKGPGWGLAALVVHARGIHLAEDARRRLFDSDEPPPALPPLDGPSSARLPAPPASEHPLRLARDLAQAMGGTLVAESRPDDGLRLLLHLDLQAAGAPGAEPPPRPLQQVLVVDDAEAYGRLLVQALADAGIGAQAVGSLAAAGQALAHRAGHPRVDLVLCDSHLGDGGLADWLGWCQAWRGEGRLVPPVIGMSADFDTAEITQLSALGALDLLTKDGDLADLVRRVQRIWAGQPG